MKLNSYLNPQNSDTDGGGGDGSIPEITAEVAQAAPVVETVQSTEQSAPTDKKGKGPTLRNPTKDELAITFADLDSPEVPVVVKKEEKKVEVPKTEEKKVEPVVAKTEVAPAIVEKPKATFEEPIDPTKLVGKPKEFDYNGHSDDEVKVLKNMSVQSREVVSKLMKEKKQLEGLKEATFLQHPNAYTLAPEYQKMNEDKFFIEQEYKHWETQLLKIKAGEEWQPIKGWNPKTGEPILDVPRKPTTLDDTNVSMRMQQCISAYQQNGQQQQQFVGNYSQRLQQDQQGIQAERNRRFTWAADPKILDHKMYVNDTVGEVPIRQVKEDFKKIFPMYHQQSPLMELCSDMFVSTLLFGNQLRAALAGKEVAETKKEEVMRAEPTSKNQQTSQGKVVNGVKEFSMEGMLPS